MQEMEESGPVEPTEPAPLQGPPRQTLTTGQKIAIVVGAVVIVALISLLLYGMVSRPDLTSILRDISIIVLALVTIVTGIFLAIMLMQLQALIVLLREEIYPLLQSMNQTADTVRGTTNFVSDAVVSPMINAASYVSGVRQSLRVLTGGSNRRNASRRGTQPGPESSSGSNRVRPVTDKKD
jgi:hypothetical protein